MSEYTDAIEAVTSRYQQAGTGLALDKSPDEAARAFELSAASGAPADQIAPNIDEFETQHKQILGQQILNQNPSLTSFVNAHPLHGQLINDDLGNLDTFTKAMERLNGKHAAEAGFRGFAEHFGGDIGRPSEEWIREHLPLANSFARFTYKTLFGLPVELMARTFSGGVGFVKEFTNQYGKDMGLSEQASQKFSNDIAGLAEYELTKPSVGPEVPHEASPAPPSGEASPPAGVVPPDLGRRLVQELGPYLEAGERPPPGSNPLTDLLYEHQAEQNKEMLKEAFDAGDKSVLKQRSPDKFAELMDHVAPQTARIPAEVLAKNPDVAEALGVSPERLQATGSVGVQVKDLLRLGKDQHKAIEDDIALGDDLSVNEVKEIKEVIAYHGSPYDFDKFDISKIGTGEGAQAYGHGLYFAENKDVAEGYRDALSNLTWQLKGPARTPENQAMIKYIQNIADRGATPEDAMGALRDEVRGQFNASQDVQTRHDMSPEWRERQIAYRQEQGLKAQNALDWLIDHKGDISSGRMYQVAIKADPEHFLDWDKPLSEQSEHVRNALKKAGLEPQEADLGEFAGQTVKSAPRWADTPEQMAALREAGIPGINYLDQGSRFAERQGIEREISGYERELATPDLPKDHIERVQEALTEAKAQLAKLGPDTSTRNYVVFDDSLLQITHKDSDPVLDTIRQTSGLEPKAVEEPKSTEEPLIRREDGPPRELGAGVPLARSAIGRTGREMTRYEQLIAQRDAEDMEWRLKRAEAQAKRENSTDWKAEADRIRSEVEADVRSRPDIAAYKFFDDGEYMGQKLGRRPKLARDRLTDEQIDQLPDRFVSDRGMDPDDVANLWGFSDGEELIRTIAATDREAAGFRGDIVKRLTDAEVFRRVNEKLGESAAERLEEAKDHALSLTQMEMLHEQTLALGQRIGAQAPVTKQAMDFGALQLLNEEVFGAMKSDRYLREAGKASRRLEKALLADDPLVAFQNAQAQYISAQMAKDARKIERQAKVFNRQAKRFRDREVAGFDTEETAPYKRWVQDILMRLGRTVARTEEDLATEIQASADTSLKAFLDSKTAEGKEISVPDFLVDPAFKKPIEELSVLQARQAMRAVNSLIKNGREEGQIIVAGEKMDRKEFMDKAVEQLAELGPAKDLAYSKGIWTGIRKAGRTYLAMTLQAESILNRWDRGNAFGLFNKWVGRPLFEASSYEAKLDKEIGGLYGKLPGQLSKQDLNASVPNTIFKRPSWNNDGTFDFDSPPPVAMTRRNLRAVLLNVGNASNMKKLAEGYRLEPGQIMQWLSHNATKEDWDWAQAHGDLFKRLKSESDNMYRRMSGEAPEAIELQALPTSFGTYDGWYHPLIFDDHYVMRKDKNPEGLFSSDYTRATTPAGYTKERTNFTAPLSLDLDAVPGRFFQEIHDIAFREAVVNASKVFYDSRFRNAVRTYYGREFENLFIPYLEDVANSANVASGNQAAFTRWSEFARQNIIGTMIGLNPRTIEKHTLTAAMNSITEVGAKEFGQAFASLWSTDPARGKKNWDWAMDTFEELGRRHQNFQEQIRGAQQTALGEGGLRKTMLQLGTKPVAYLDLLSAVPTAIAEYTKAIEAGMSEADAIYAGNRAVRRAHGSTATTNRPEIMRRGIAGMGGGWITSLYGFMNHIANRQYELAWKAKEAAGLVKEGEVGEALKQAPQLALGLFSYVVFVAVVDELVTPSGSSKDTFEKQVSKGGLKMMAAPWPIARDVATAIVEHKDPTLGLANSEAKAFTDIGRDVWKGDYGLNRQHAGKTIKHAMTAFGAATGLVNSEMGNLAEYLYDLHTGKARPKSMKDWWRGLTKGEAKPRDNRPDLVERGLRVIEGGR